MTDHIQTSLDNQILTLTINRPERKNALTQCHVWRNGGRDCRRE